MLYYLRSSCAIVFGIYLAGCATQAPEPPTLDSGELAREVIAEQTRQAEETESKASAQAPEAETTRPAWVLSGEELHHLASGYKCAAQISGFNLRGEETYPGLGHGNDVACIYSATDGGLVKLHITNFNRDVSAAAHLKGVETNITDTYAVTNKARIALAPSTSAVARHASAFKIKAVSDLRPDIPVHTAVWISRFGPWHVKARATYEADRAHTVAGLVDKLFARASETIRPTPHQPTSPGASPS